MTQTTGTTGVLLPCDIPATDLVPFAREAEAYGFGELWVAEDLGYRGGIAQAATVLAHTRRIRVGAGLLPAAASPPPVRAPPARPTVSLGVGPL